MFYYTLFKNMNKRNFQESPVKSRIVGTLITSVICVVTGVFLAVSLMIACVKLPIRIITNLRCLDYINYEI